MLTERNFLQHLIDEAVARGEHDIARDILMKKVSRLNICAYDFKGYVGCIDSIRSYYDNSMRILNENVRKELFNPNRPIYTKIKDQVPTNYGSYASVHNSLIADGCTIEGEVKNSIIFRGVYIGNVQGQQLYCVKTRLSQEAANLDHVVMDKEVIVRESGRLIGDYNYPMIIGKGAVV